MKRSPLGEKEKSISDKVRGEEILIKGKGKARKLELKLGIKQSSPGSERQATCPVK